MLRRFSRDTRGATAIEYGLVAALIGIAIIAGALALGHQLNDTFCEITEPLSSGMDGSGGSDDSCSSSEAKAADTED